MSTWGEPMAALGLLRRVLRSGTLAGALMLAAAASAASADRSPEPAAPIALGARSAAPSEDAGAGKADVASERAANAEGGVALDPTAAELETIILRTLSAADLQALVTEAAAGAVLETDPRVRALGAELDLREEALARIFEMLGPQDVPPERLAEVLATIVARHHSLLERVQLVEASQPRAAELRDAVVAALETVDYERVDTLLAEAEAIEFEAMEQLLEALGLRVLEAAAIYPDAGDLAGTWLGYKAAQRGALLHRAGRAGFGGFLPLFPRGRFCQWHFGHRLCERLADSSRFCERRPNHPLCDDDRFCKKRPDHPLCDDDPPPSPS
jgi:hypothetical protein